MDLIKNLFRMGVRADRGNDGDIAKSGSPRKRLSLARDSKTSKEILYYLAENDPDPKIRRAVVKNKAMPLQVSTILAGDSDQDVRLALAGRLVNLLPNVSEDKHSQLYAYVVQALGTLALDEVLKIRVALSSTLKDHAHTPPKVAGQLARDVEREVSEPILRFCAALSDEDLINILKSHPASWVVEAVAGRSSVSEPVSEAVIDTEDISGGRVLIGNEAAQMGKGLLHYIVQKARTLPEWQEPMAKRKSLPMSVIRELAEFVDYSVRDILTEREDFDEEMTAEIAEIFRRRIEYATENGGLNEPVEERLRRKISAGELDEDAISDAMGMRDYDFVYGAIAYMAKTDMGTIEKIFDTKAAKSIVALSWHAGLSMRLAIRLQKDLAKVPHKDILYAKAGEDYPLSEDQLIWQLEFLGLKVA